MSPRGSASPRRQSFTSIELAKEAAGSNPIVKNAGLKGLTKRHWIPAAFIYVLSVTGASVGFYYLGDNNGFESCAAQVNEGLPPIPTLHPVGPLTDVDGTHYAFRDGYVAHSWKGDIAKDPYATGEKYDKYFWDKFANGEDDIPGYSVPSQRAAPAASTLTKRKRDLPAPTAGVPEVVVEEIEELLSGSDSDSDELVVVEEASGSGSDSEVVVVEEDSGSDSDGPTEVTVEEATAEPDVVEISDPSAPADVVEIDDPTAPADVVEIDDPSAPADVVEVSDPSAPADVVEISDPTAEPDVVEISDPTAPADVVEITDPTPDVVIQDEAPEIVLEESEVEESDSEFVNLARRSTHGGWDDYGPSASGNQPGAYSGQGDRAVTHGIRRRPNIPESYVDHLEIPKGPQAHRAIIDTERGGYRISDPYYPAADKAVYRAAPQPVGPAVVTAAAKGDAAPSGYVVTITVPYHPRATHVPAN